MMLADPRLSALHCARARSCVCARESGADENALGVRLRADEMPVVCACVLQVIVCERSMAAFLGSPFAEFAKRHPRGFQGKVLKYLLCENGTGVAPVFIIFNAGLTATLVWLP